MARYEVLATKVERQLAVKVRERAHAEDRTTSAFLRRLIVNALDGAQR